MFSLKRNQLLLILGAVVMIVVLLSLELRPPKTSSSRGGAKEEQAAKPVELSLSTESKFARESITADSRKRIEQMENGLDKLSGKAKTERTRQIAEAYAASNQFAAAGMYYKELIALDNTAQNRVLAGDAFRNAYRNTNDSVKFAAYVDLSRTYYNEALTMQADNLDAKSGLGSTYVDASENPMQGIQLLLEVVKQDPENINANLNLGLFSIRSGQYDKAIARFETVVKQKPSAETYAMLADAYEQTGDKTRAIKALEKAKEYVIDPQIISGIDEYIKKLK